MLRKLQEANRERQKLWDPDWLISPTYRATELAGEVGEALNIVKKLERERMGLKGSRSCAADLADELADVIICTALLADDYGIDLSEAVAKKFNATSAKVGFSVFLEQE